MSNTLPTAPPKIPLGQLTAGALHRLRRLGALLTLMACRPHITRPIQLLLRQDPFEPFPTMALEPTVPFPTSDTRYSEFVSRLSSALPPPASGRRREDPVCSGIIADTLAGADGQDLRDFLCLLGQRDSKALLRAPARTARWASQLSSVDVSLDPGWRSGIRLERSKATASAHQIVDASFCVAERDDALAAVARILTQPLPD